MLIFFTMLVPAIFLGSVVAAGVYARIQSGELDYGAIVRWILTETKFSNKQAVRYPSGFAGLSSAHPVLRATPEFRYIGCIFRASGHSVRRPLRSDAAMSCHLQRFINPAKLGLFKLFRSHFSNNNTVCMRIP